MRIKGKSYGKPLEFWLTPTDTPPPCGTPPHPPAAQNPPGRTAPAPNPRVAAPPPTGPVALATASAKLCVPISVVSTNSAARSLPIAATRQTRDRGQSPATVPATPPPTGWQTTRCHRRSWPPAERQAGCRQTHPLADLVRLNAKAEGGIDVGEFGVTLEGLEDRLCLHRDARIRRFICRAW